MPDVGGDEGWIGNIVEPDPDIGSRMSAFTGIVAVGDPSLRRRSLAKICYRLRVLMTGALSDRITDGEFQGSTDWVTSSIRPCRPEFPQ